MKGQRVSQFRPSALAACAAISIVWTGCGGGAGTKAATSPAAVAPPTEPTAAPPTAEPAEPPKPRVFAELGAGDVKAPWLAPALAAKPDDPYELRTIAALGKRIAVGETRAGYYVMTLDRGSVGPLAVPAEARVIGVDGRDGIIAAATDGTIYRAPNAVAGLKPAGFVRVGKGPTPADANATMSYDVAGKWIVAGDGTTLWFSGNGGKRFRIFRAKKRDSVERAVVRADGIMVLSIKNASDDAAKTYVSKRGGKPVLASFQATGVFRIGAWIMDSGEGDCTAVLARDGTRWVRENTSPGDVQAARLTRWQSAFGHGVTPAQPLDPVATLATANTPATPRATKQNVLTGADKGCPAGGGGSGYGSYTALGDIAGLPMHPTRHELHLTHDGVTGSHPPRAARTDATASSGNQVALLDLPKSCDPVFATSARGLGVLGCRGGDKGGKLDLYELTAAGSWTLAAQLADGYEARPGSNTTSKRPRRAFSVAPDGSIGMVPHCTATCGVYVRAPVAAGTANAWRRIVVPNAIAYRIVSGGRVVAMVSTASFEPKNIPATGRAPVPVQFVLSDGTTTKPLAEVKVGMRISAFAVAENQIGVMLMRGAEYAPFMISTTGELIQAQ